MESEPAFIPRQVHLAAFAVLNPQLLYKSLPSVQPTVLQPTVQQPSIIMFSRLLYAVCTGFAWLSPGPLTQQATNNFTNASPSTTMTLSTLPPGFNLLDTSISELAGLLNNGTLSSETLVATYLGESWHTPAALWQFAHSRQH